jgi:radical SAM-linked protein
MTERESTDAGETGPRGSKALMGLDGAGVSPAIETRSQVGFAFRVEGDVRYLSHRDMLRMFRRALARADLPVRFTEGFNPRPRMSIPLPRPVGVASEAELLVLEFDPPVEPSVAAERLALQMPDGIRIVEGRSLTRGSAPQPSQARYRIEPDGPVPGDLEHRFRHIIEQEVIEVTRTDPGSGAARRIDVRPFILEFRMDGSAIEFDTVITGRGTVRPAEVGALLGFDPVSINHRIRRMEVRWH